MSDLKQDLKIVHSLRARRLSIGVRASGEVRVVIPRGVSEAEALHFVEQKRDWIVKAQVRMTKRVQNTVITLPYSTRKHTLNLRPDATNHISAHVSGGYITITYPAHISYEHSDVQAIIKKGIEEAWRIEAKEYLPSRTAQLASALSFRYGAVTIRNSRTRWGSCSSRDDLSLSLHLMKLPDNLIDYIIIHELCHTVHKNHGVRFHRLLDKCTNGEHKALRIALKNYSTQ